MGNDARKLVYRVSDKERLGRVCSATEANYNIEFFHAASGHNTFHEVNNKGSERTVQILRLVCNFFVRRQSFLRRGSYHVTVPT